MASGPYRTSIERAPPPPAEPVSLEVPVAAGFLSLVTSVRLTASLLRAEPMSAELLFSWFVLIAALVMLGQELLARRAWHRTCWRRGRDERQRHRIRRPDLPPP
jgi:hypothetical protein